MHTIEGITTYQLRAMHANDIPIEERFPWFWVSFSPRYCTQVWGLIPFLKWKENNADVPMEAMVWEDQFLR